MNPSSGKRIGYVRVSTVEQNPDRQLEGVQLDRKFVEFASARDTNRPQLRILLEYVRDGDTVFVHSMDRLARNIMDLRKIVDGLVERDVQVHFVKESMIFNGSDSAMSNLLLSVMGSFSQFEYEFMKERQREGISIAKASGKYRGRRTKLTPERAEIIRKELTTRKSKSQIAREIGISRESLYRYLKEMKL